MFHLVPLSFALFAAPSPQDPTATRMEVTVRSGDIDLAATYHRPARSGRVPGVVIVHGLGDSDRTNPWTSAWVDALVARGVAVLHPDKRGSGRSKGDWHTASFEVLAEDAMHAVGWMRRQDHVAADFVGVIGFSQGVDVIPVLAARPHCCDFVISVSGSVVPLREQVVDEIALGAAKQGKPMSPAQRTTVDTLHALAFRVANGEVGWEALQGEVKTRCADDAGLAPLVRGLTAPADHWVWKWIRAVGDFDPAPHWQRVDVPMVFVYGGADTQVDGKKSLARLRELFADRPRNWSALEFGANGHALFREDLLDFIARWLRDRGAH